MADVARGAATSVVSPREGKKHQWTRETAEYRLMIHSALYKADASSAVACHVPKLVCQGKSR
jgi:hypothetical protein